MTTPATIRNPAALSLQCPRKVDQSIMIRAQPPSWRQFAWCLALAMSLLVTQFSGQWHRINHARWLAGAAQAQTENTDRQWSGLGDVSHSCIALDALSLANGAAGATTLPLLTIHAALIFTSLTPSFWDAPFHAQFRSRAPPACQ